MWIIRSIYLKHFRSHVETFYEPKQATSTLVYGHNFDEPDSADSNGTGKSTILTGITIALVGLPDKNLSNSDYVMDNKEFAVVELEMSNDVMGLHVKISRTLYAKIGKPTKFFLYENEELNKQIISEKRGTAYILEDLLDIAKEDLLNYFIINQDNSHSFFNATDGKQKAIIARFSNTDKLDIVIDEVKMDEANFLKSIETDGLAIERHEMSISNLEEQIEYEEVGRLKTNEGLLEDFREEIGEMRNDVIQQENELENVLETFKEIEKKLSKIEGCDVLIDGVNKKRKAVRLKLRESQKMIIGVEKVLAGAIICPKCEHEFSLVKKVDFADYRKLEKKLQSTIKKIETKIKRLNDSLETLEEKDEKFSKLEKRLANLKDSIELKGKRAKRLEREIKNVKQKMGKIEQNSIDKKRVGELKSNIKKRFELIEDLKVEIEKKHQQLEDITFWKVNFGLTGFKTFLINKTLSNFEGHVNSYLKKFKIDLKAKINGFKILRGGDVRENIEVLINKSGKGWKKFKRYSGGQRERVNICGILTLRKLINLSSKNGGLNFLGLDETFEGLDIKGQQMVLPILENCGVTIMMITHMNYDIGAKNRLDIDYKNEVSKLRNGKKEKNQKTKTGKTR